MTTNTLKTLRTAQIKGWRERTYGAGHELHDREAAMRAEIVELRTLIATIEAQPVQEPVAEIFWTNENPEWQLKMLVEPSCPHNERIKVYAGDYIAAPLLYVDTVQPKAEPVQQYPAQWATFLHYPEHWDTAAYPTLHDAIHEALAWSGCSVCKADPVVKDSLTTEPTDKDSLSVEPVQEPVAWQERQSFNVGWSKWYYCDSRLPSSKTEMVIDHITYQWRPLYAAPVQTVEQQNQYPLPDDLYDSKDWRAGNYAERVEWLHGMYESSKEQINAVPLTDEQVQDMLKKGNPTDDEYRLIRMGWDERGSQEKAVPLTQPDMQRLWNDACYSNGQSTNDAAMAFGVMVQAAQGIGVFK